MPSHRRRMLEAIGWFFHDCAIAPVLLAMA